MKINTLSDLRAFHSAYIHKRFSLQGSITKWGILRDVTFPRNPDSNPASLQAILVVEDELIGRREVVHIYHKDLVRGIQVTNPDIVSAPKPPTFDTVIDGAVIDGEALKTDLHKTLYPITSTNMRMPAYSPVHKPLDLVMPHPMTLQITKGDTNITGNFIFERLEHYNYKGQMKVVLKSVEWGFQLELFDTDIRTGIVKKKGLA